MDYNIVTMVRKCHNSILLNILLINVNLILLTVDHVLSDTFCPTYMHTQNLVYDVLSTWMILHDILYVI